MPTADNTETRYKRLWFGPKAAVTIGPGFLHRSGIGTLLVPHPPIANWLLRRGIPWQLSRDLSFAHEFAHLQTVPLLLLYLLTLLSLAFARDRTGAGVVLLILASAQAAWEIVSEGVLLLQNPATYRQFYKMRPWLPRVLFWIAGCLFSVAGWVAALHS